MANIDEMIEKVRRPRTRGKKASSALDSPDPIEIAMKVVAAGAEAHGPARAVLEKHAALIDVQCRREHQELANVRVQRITRWLILAAVAALLAGIAAAVIAASRSRTLVIEPMSVPSELEARGLTGRVVSARLLDRLAQFQRETESVRPTNSYANNWEDEIRVDLGGTGISLAESWGTLRRLLGEETRISGELTLGSDGHLSITTRAGAQSGGTTVGFENDLDTMITRAAEGIYRVTQPYRYAVYAGRDGPSGERTEVLMELSRSSDQNERKWALNGLSVDFREIGDAQRALESAQAALDIDPRLVPALANTASAHQLRGDDERALYYLRRVIDESRRSSSEAYDERIMRGNMTNWSLSLAHYFQDRARAVAALSDRARLGLMTFDQAAQAASWAPVLTMTHQHRQALNAAAQVRGGRFYRPEDTAVIQARTALNAAIDLGNATAAGEAAANLIRAGDRLVASDARDARHYRTNRMVGDLPLAAIGFAAAGRFAEANELLAHVPNDCYPCARARGIVADYRGDKAAARNWLRSAIELAPSLPRAYLDLARVEAPRDPARALELAREARQRGPAWADPLKLIGDLQVRRGDIAGAERSYHAAAELAPRWGAVHLKWAGALWRLGRFEEARQKLNAASAMDLGPRDAARLSRMLTVAHERPPRRRS